MKKPVYMAWIKNGFRVTLSQRLIKRGKQKGHIEVAYKKGFKVKTIIVTADSIRELST